VLKESQSPSSTPAPGRRKKRETSAIKKSEPTGQDFKKKKKEPARWEGLSTWGKRRKGYTSQRDARTPWKGRHTPSCSEKGASSKEKKIHNVARQKGTLILGPLAREVPRGGLEKKIL